MCTVAMVSMSMLSRYNVYLNILVSMLGNIVEAEMSLVFQGFGHTQRIRRTETVMQEKFFGLKLLQFWAKFHGNPSNKTT